MAGVYLQQEYSAPDVAKTYRAVYEEVLKCIPERDGGKAKEA